MSGHLRKYLIRQAHRIRFYELVARFVVVGLFFSLVFQFLNLLSFLAEYFVAHSAQSNFTIAFLLSLIFAIYQVWIWFHSPETEKEVASLVERQSRYFDQYPQHRSELVTAASLTEVSKDFERAHYQTWSLRLDNYRVELLPSWKLVLGLFLVVPILLVSLVGIPKLPHMLPQRIEAWNLAEFEQKLAYESAEWELKRGAVSAVIGSKIRIRAPEYSFLQTYLFLQTDSNAWVYEACQEYCEFEVRSRGRYAVGSLLFRSAKFPLLAVPDELPRASLFLKEGQDLVPSPTISVLNQDALPLRLMATDDLALKAVKLIHRFEDQEDVLFESSAEALRFSKDFDLVLRDWKGGRHEVIFIAEDFFQSQESSPLVIVYADEEFLRQQRILSLRSLIDQWVHVLGDLLESKEDRRFHPMLFERLGEMDWPAIDQEGAAQVYVEEMRRLADRFLNELPIRGVSQLPEAIETTEKQILYGLSLIFQERAGDLQDSSRNLQSAQADLQSLVDQIKSGQTELTPEALQEAFERLTRQIEELQEKMKNLPQGPNDDMINREALNEQLNESQELQERIAEIQQQIADGDHEAALRELESLMNQLSILSKEIGRSFDQWEDNLAKGALESSKNFESKLKELRDRQEKLAEKTKDLERQQREWDPQDSYDPEKLKKIEEDFDKTEEEQRQLAEEFESIKSDFEQSLEGSEWEQVFRSDEMAEIEEAIQERMDKASEALRSRESSEALVQELEAAEWMRKAEEAQQQMRQNVEQMSQPQASGESRRNEKIEIIGSEGRGERERRQKIMNSLRQKVDENFQKSHERYFEELLQR